MSRAQRAPASSSAAWQQSRTTGKGRSRLAGTNRITDIVKAVVVLHHAPI
jgi:hypothetical protein